MTFLFSRRSLAVMLAVLLAALSGGCARPDRWAVFRDEPGPPVPGKDALPVIVTEEVRPRLASEPPLPLPDEGLLALSVEQASMLVLRNNRNNFV